MKVTPKEYAVGLFNSIYGKDGGEVKNIINKFVNLLIKNNDLSKSGKISEIFSSLWNEAEEVVESEVITAKKLDGESIETLKDFLIKQSYAKKVTIKEKIDRNILGGMIIRYNDKVLDKSLKTKIKNLSNSIKG